MKNSSSIFLLTTVLSSAILNSSIVPTIATNQATHMLLAQISKLTPRVNQSIPFFQEKEPIIRHTPDQLFASIAPKYKSATTGMFKQTAKCLMSWQHQNISPYDVLHISQDITDLKIIKNAYLNKAKTTHPDSKNGSEEDFKKVNAAYKYLEWCIKNNQPINNPYHQNIQQNSGYNNFYYDQEPEDKEEKNTDNNSQTSINHEKLNKLYYPLGLICGTCTTYKLYKDIINKREKSLFSGLKLISKVNKNKIKNNNNDKNEGILLLIIMSYVALRETYYGAIEIYDDFIAKKN